ncbi:MAG: hypothetical protein WC521_00610 [Bdellovibrionales bacterium]
MIRQFHLFICAFFLFSLCSLPARADTSEDSRAALSRVKVGLVYENVTDGVEIKRSLEETNAILKATRADFLFRGFWKDEPIVDSPDRIPPQLHSLAREEGIDRLTERIRKTGKSYDVLREWIAGIKRENPSLLFCGSLPAQHVSKIEVDPMSGRVYSPDETWAMALDPRKWNVILRDKGSTKEEVQARLSGSDVHPYDRRLATAYAPDITNSEFQSLLINLAKKQIDLGADALWIDGLLSQTKLFFNATNDTHHPAVKESYGAAVKIIDDIRRYGADRGKYILVGTWGQGEDSLLTLSPRLQPDFVTVTPSAKEMDQKQLDAREWDAKLAGIRQAYGDIPIFAFIDWSLDVSPLASFSQNLSAEEQKSMLQTLDTFFAQRGVNFIYPVHGGYMGKNPAKRAFGKFETYDSLAPEFNTIETIETLATAKALQR